MFNDPDEMVDCPACGTVQAWEEALLGVLGTKIHMRCVGCGWQWRESTEEVTEEAD